MTSRYPIFDRSALHLRSLSERKHDLDISHILELHSAEAKTFPEIEQFSKHLLKAAQNQSCRILILGAHVIRAGVQHYITDMMRRGFISLIAVNGACIIHDYEFSLVGATTESVATYIDSGQFGLWQETGALNDIIRDGAENGLGLGESVGKFMTKNTFTFADSSIVAEAYRLNIPVTVHVGIGYDIIHEHPNCDGHALGATSYRDFLIFTEHLKKLNGGVVMNFGSAVMGPEVFLKALAMVKNVSKNQRRSELSFNTLVCDLKHLPPDYHREASKSDPLYYFRPWKTLLVRTTGNNGKSYYTCGNHRHTIPALWSCLPTKE